MDSTDAWGIIGFGGGGATFYPSSKPHRLQGGLVSCDMTGSYTTGRMVDDVANVSHCHGLSHS
jgi:hypothetical protein